MNYITDLEIANKALLKLGQREIVSFDAAEENARTVKALYGTVRDYTLSVYRWAFALKRAVLPRDEACPAFGFKYQYTLPADFLRLETIYNKPYPGFDAYSIEGNKILTDVAAPLQIIYLSREQDQKRWPPYFVEAFTCRLALALCERIKQDPQRKQVLMQELELVMQDAKRSNALQSPVRRLTRTRWEDAHDGF